jgi:hypothetical protein
MTSMGRLHNRDYYRDLAAYLRERTFLCPVGLAVTNPSTTVAEEVVVTLEIGTADVSVLGEDDLPPQPSTDWIPRINAIRPHQAQRVEVAQFGEIYEVRAQIGNVQPGTTGWSVRPFYIGARHTITVEAKITISANNLRVPVSGVATISIEATSRKLGVSDIKAMDLGDSADG